MMADVRCLARTEPHLFGLDEKPVTCCLPKGHAGPHQALWGGTALNDKGEGIEYYVHVKFSQGGTRMPPEHIPLVGR